MSQENGPQENAPQEDKKDDTMPSASKQIMVMVIIVIGITVVLGGGVMLSNFLR
jgi:flagellar basal body-associated protein FliL|tara:strand:- start:458 stop:619 length:162 start_codon:yes stop_codon:yes gene_type:complete